MTKDLHEVLETSRELSYHNPADLLWRINPEAASLAYANKSGFLTKDILPYIARFRELQSEEKIQLLEHMTQVHGINTQERINGRAWDGRVDVQALSEAGETERVRILADATSDAEKLKYETLRALALSDGSVRKHMSDNQLEATKQEAYALRDILGTQAAVMRDVTDMTSSRDLLGRFKEAEFSYLGRVKEAEMLRQGEVTRAEADLSLAYIQEQGNMARSLVALDAQRMQIDASERMNASSNNAMVRAEIERAEGLEQVERLRKQGATSVASYQALQALIAHGAQALIAKDGKLFLGEAATNDGIIEVRMRVVQ